MSVVYASDEIISVAEAVPEDVDAAPEIDDAAISEAEIQELPAEEAEYAEADQTLADEELVSATAPVQASKSSQDGEYVGRATTMQSGPANPREPKIYTLDLNEHNYPLKNANRADYMQGVGILYPGDKLQIIGETDPNPGGYGDHGTPGKVLMTEADANNHKEPCFLQRGALGLPEKDNDGLYNGRAEREIRRRCELFERTDRDIPVQGEIETFSHYKCGGAL